MTDNDKPKENEFWNQEIFENLMIANSHTQGHNKIWQYFFEIVKSKQYQAEIGKLRKKYGITNDTWDSSNLKYDRRLRRDIDSLCSLFSLHCVDWEEYILDDLFYRKIEPYDDLVGNNLCRFLDLQEDIFEQYFIDTDWRQRVGSVTMSELNAFPLAITVSPYASKRDILDYVEKMYPMIKAWQMRRRDKGIKIGQIRTKRVQERDDFIYQNRDKSGKELSRMVKEKFGGKLLPYEYILKIKYREIKRRK